MKIYIKSIELDNNQWLAIAILHNGLVVAQETFTSFYEAEFFLHQTAKLNYNQLFNKYELINNDKMFKKALIKNINLESNNIYSKLLNKIKAKLDWLIFILKNKLFRYKFI